jgi:hypothetical protein
MDTDEEVSESEAAKEEPSDDESVIGHACIARASTHASNFFNNDASDNEVPAYCFMAKASREQVSPKRQKAHAKNDFSSEDDVYAKLIRIANIQQDPLEKLEKTLRKSEGLLVEEMEKNKMLTNEHSALLSTFKDLSMLHDSIAPLTSEKMRTLTLL